MKGYSVHGLDTTFYENNYAFVPFKGKKELIRMSMVISSTTEDTTDSDSTPDPVDISPTSPQSPNIDPSQKVEDDPKKASEAQDHTVSKLDFIKGRNLLLKMRWVTINGKVYSKSNGNKQKLKGAKITINDSTISSDESGEFVLKLNIPKNQKNY